MMDKKQWKGLASLVADAVSAGASSVERIHLTVSGKPFDVLAELPIVSTPSAVVRVTHDLSARVTPRMLAYVTRGVFHAVDLAIDVAFGNE